MGFLNICETMFPRDPGRHASHGGGAVFTCRVNVGSGVHTDMLMSVPTPVRIDPGVPTPARPRPPPSPLARLPADPATSCAPLALSVHALRTHTCMHRLVTSLFSALQQILGPLDHDDQCGKQKLAYKLEQVITLMSLDS